LVVVREARAADLRDENQRVARYYEEQNRQREERERTNK
jgi:hypothetical protein